MSYLWGRQIGLQLFLQQLLFVRYYFILKTAVSKNNPPWSVVCDFGYLANGFATIAPNKMSVVARKNCTPGISEKATMPIMIAHKIDRYS